MASLKVVERGRLTGQGKTVAEAKQDLNRQIDELVTGSYQPVLVNYGPYTAIVYRSIDGWQYRLVHEITPGIREINYGTIYDSKDAAIQGAAFHVLDIGSDIEEFHKDEDIPDWLTDKGKRDTVLSNARFHRAYKWAKGNKPDGIDDDNKWHRWACDHSRDEQFK